MDLWGLSNPYIVYLGWLSLLCEHTKEFSSVFSMPAKMSQLTPSRIAYDDFSAILVAACTGGRRGNMTRAAIKEAALQALKLQSTEQMIIPINVFAPPHTPTDGQIKLIFCDCVRWL